MVAFARSLADETILLWEGWTINRTLDDEGEVATGITYDWLTLSIEDALELGVIDLQGRTDRYKLGLLMQGGTMPGEWIRPHQTASRPAGRPRH